MLETTSHPCNKFPALHSNVTDFSVNGSESGPQRDLISSASFTPNARYSAKSSEEI
jgi:hypothetical protein